MPGFINHIEWSVSDVDRISRLLVHDYGFVPYARRSGSEVCRQEVVKSGSTLFVLTEKRESDELVDSDQEYPVYQTSKKIDSLFNICIRVDDVDLVIERAVQMGAKLLHMPKTIQDNHGKIRLAVIKSCVGNVIHSLVSLEDYSGHFLPGFVPADNYDRAEAGKGEITQSIDHVTYVCDSGQSDLILDWYAKCFGMKRFLVNASEDYDEGIVIGEEVGMRMKVGEWISSWLCREVGVQFEADQDQREGSNGMNFKLVLAEPLPNRNDTHVQKFLDEHEGPGIQHIGLTTDNIERTVQLLTDRGAQFRKPPPTYYELESKVTEIVENGFSIDKFKKLGLLLDSEADFDDGQNKALVQIFTKPIFIDRDTFFLEVLQRKGARGFGAGNITALARSVLLYQKELLENNNNFE